MHFDNIIFRDINITNPAQSPGVIVGNKTNPVKNVLFENVNVHYTHSNGSNPEPFGNAYYCVGAENIFSTTSIPTINCPNNATISTSLEKDFFTNKIVGDPLVALLADAS